MILSDDGRGIHSRAGARNAAEAVALAVDQPERAMGQAYHVADDDLVTVHQWAEIVARAAGRELEFKALPGQLVTPGWAVLPFGYQGTPSCVLDTTKLRVELGYRDVLPLRDGLAETVEWMIANADSMRGNPNVLDPFDYPAEDRLVAAYERSLAELSELQQPFAAVGRMTVPQMRSSKG
jgi:hypothetical protein